MMYTQLLYSFEFQNYHPVQRSNTAVDLHFQLFRW
uniref:Uncharacterized protein n=1 Tax=Arundo donax TaxID=35708 RepID=A0A0A8ZP91_ARUDO